MSTKELQTEVGKLYHHKTIKEDEYIHYYIEGVFITKHHKDTRIQPMLDFHYNLLKKRKIK